MAPRLAGWRKFVTGEPYVRAKSMLILGDSGAHIYSPSGKKHHSVVSDLRSHAGDPNIHDLTEMGAHPARWLQMLVKWEHEHLQFALPKSGAPGGRPRFGSDLVVILCDARNGLQMIKTEYTGLDYSAPSGNSIR